MADKPYEERLGGSYLIDKSGKAVRQGGTEQPSAFRVEEPAAETPAEPETDRPAEPARKGK